MKQDSVCFLMPFSPLRGNPSVQLATVYQLLVILIKQQQQFLLLIFIALLWLFAWPQRTDSSTLPLPASILQPVDLIETLSHRHLSNRSDEMP